MPVPTSKRAGVEPPSDALFPSQILARNVGAVRRLRGYRQEFVAERMMYLGHPWTRQTVSDVERELRNVTVDELFSLALVLELTIERLLEARFVRLLAPAVRQPGRKVALLRPTSVAASRGIEGVAPEGLIDAGELHGMLCGHEIDVEVTWDGWRLQRVEFTEKDERR